MPAEYTYNVPMEETLDAFKGNLSNMPPEVRAQWEQVRATYAVAERLEKVANQLYDSTSLADSNQHALLVTLQDISVNLMNK